MKICMVPEFVKHAAKQQIEDDALIEAVTRAERGIVDAQIGKSLIK